MSAVVSHVEARLSDLFGYAGAVLFGRARSAISVLLEILGAGDGFNFVMPSNICSAVFAAARSSGAKVRLVAVSCDNGLASDRDLAAAVRKAEGPGVVMPAHLYGFVEDYPKTRAAAADAGWFVLENDSMAAKARLDKNDPGAVFGDALLVSFGYAKVIDAGGGGALLTNDAKLAEELKKAAMQLPPLDGEARAREEWRMGERRRLRRAPNDDAAARKSLDNIFFAEAEDLRHGFPDDLIAPLLSSLAALPETAARRRKRAEMWDTALAPFTDALKAPAVYQPVPWRVIRRVPGRRDAVVAALREGGIDAGTNFPPLSGTFPALPADRNQEDGAAWGQQVLNLWVTDDYDLIRIRRAAGIIGNAVES